MESRTMFKRYAVVALAVIVVLGALATVFNQKTKYRVRVTATQVEEDIRAHLPIGSSREEVEAYLDRNQFPHTYVGNSPYEACGNCEVALVRDTAHSWLIRTDIQIYFKFDRAQKLASYSVQEINTGP